MGFLERRRRRMNHKTLAVFEKLEKWLRTDSGFVRGDGPDKPAETSRSLNHLANYCRAKADELWDEGEKERSSRYHELGRLYVARADELERKEHANRNSEENQRAEEKHPEATQVLEGSKG